MRLPLEPLSSRTHTIFCLQCLLLRWRVYPSFGLPHITATTVVVLPSGEAIGVLWLLCISSLWLDDVTVTSSALLNVKGLLYVAGLLGVAGLLNVMESQRIAGLLNVARLLFFAELQRIAGLLSITGLAMSWLLTICWLLTILLSLVDSEGVALIGLGGVNLDC